VEEYLGGNERGIDVFPYESLGPQNIVEDPSRLPFEQGEFETVTYIANVNHVPRHLRDAEIAEAFRCYKRGGKDILVTMGSILAEILTHPAFAVCDRLFETKYDIDHLRGMQEGEDCFVTGREVRLRLKRAGFVQVSRRRFWTQWGLNGMYIGWKPT
jgi:SAM-dependent methyltransferase